MTTVLITPSPLAGADGPHLKVLRDAGFQLRFPPRPVQLTADELVPCLDGVQAIIAGSEPYTSQVFSAAPTLRVIARAGVGYDAVDLKTATANGVVVTITPGTNQEAVAEHTFSLILALAKRVVAQHIAVRMGGWPRKPTVPLRGQALGVVGLGRIGKAVAVRGAAFGMRLLAHEPIPDREFVTHYGVTLLPFDQLLAEADFLTLHAPLCDESRHLIDAKNLARMKPTAYLINTARGGLVREADLLDALRQGRIAGAGLDVFEHEPPGTNPLFDLENVVLTAHTAGVDTVSLYDMAVAAAKSIIALGQGQWPADQVVNPEVKDRFRW